VSDDDINRLLQKHRFAAAFELLLQRYQDKVFRLAVSILRDATKAEEVTQDIFLKLWRVLPAYDGRAGVSTWLYTIARNTCLTAARAESYRTTLELQESQAPALRETISRTPEMKQLVDRLPDIQREAITLFYFQDHSVQDIADMLGLPEGTIKSHLHRARQSLAQLMGERK